MAVIKYEPTNGLLICVLLAEIYLYFTLLAEVEVQVRRLTNIPAVWVVSGGGIMGCLIKQNS